MASTLSNLSPEQLRNLGKNVILLKEAEAIASVLEVRGIAALFLKGIALLDSVYKCPFPRAMDDIDILVHTGNLAAAIATLRDAGYVAMPNALVLSKSVGEILVQIDLHWELWLFSTEDYWHRSVKKDPNSRIKILSAEDEFLHCILHGAIQDGEISGQALADCTAILAAYGARFSWNRFRDIIFKEGWEQPVALFLNNLAAISPAAIPHDLVGNSQARDRAWAIIKAAASPYSRMIRFQSRWSKRLRLVLRLLFPNPHFLRMRYSGMPESLSFLLPVLRPFFLFAEFLSVRLRFFER